MINFLQVVGGSQTVQQSWYCDMIPASQWYELTLTKASGVYTLRLNGAAQTQTVNTGASVAIADFAGALVIGEVDNNDIEGMNGNVDELMISNVARHTSDFTPPNAPYGLLYNVLTDSSLYNKTVVMNGGAALDTINKIFGASSILFPTAPSSPSYLAVPNSPHWAFGMDDFEIDARIKFSSFPQRVNGILAQYQDANNTTQLYYDSTYQWIIWRQCVGGTWNVIQTWNCPLDTNWHEITLTKANGVYVLRLDGITQSVYGTPTGSATAIASLNGSLIIGGLDATDSQDMNGNIDELMISRAAVHTADFTPAILPYGVLSAVASFFGLLPINRVQSTPVISHTSDFSNLGDPFGIAVNGVLNVFYTKYVNGSGDNPQIVRRPIVGSVLATASYGYLKYPSCRRVSAEPGIRGERGSTRSSMTAVEH